MNVAISNRIRPLGRGSSFGGIFATLLIHVSLIALIYFAHVKTPVLKLTEDPNAPPTPKEAPKIEDADISKDMRRALKRAQMLAQATEEPAEGSLTGSPLGRATEGVSGDAWATAVDAAIHNAWSTPVGLITDAELVKLVAKVRISISDEGVLSNPIVKQSSGNQYFDDSCIQAVKAAGKVPPPPPKSKHLLLTFDGKSLAR